MSLIEFQPKKIETKPLLPKEQNNPLKIENVRKDLSKPRLNRSTRDC